MTIIFCLFLIIFLIKNIYYLSSFFIFPLQLNYLYFHVIFLQFFLFSLPTININDFYFPFLSEFLFSFFTSITYINNDKV